MIRSSRTTHSVMPGLDPGIHVLMHRKNKGVDGRDIGERSDAVLRTAMGERSDAVLRTAMGERSDAVLRTAMGERSDAVLRTAMPGHDGIHNVASAAIARPSSRCRIAAAA